MRTISNINKYIKQFFIRRKWASKVTRAVEARYGLNNSSSAKVDVTIRRFTVNYMLDQSGWTVMNLARELDSIGIDTESLSLNTLYWHRREHQISIAHESERKSRVYRGKYNSFVRVINSNI